VQRDREAGGSWTVVADGDRGDGTP
jgi:hypothetical protein